MSAYILEVQKFYVNGHIEHPEWNGKSEHIGYINKIFKTKQQACAYYDKHNPHMRSLNAHNTWCSDWDPITNLMYIVREHHYEYLKIKPFTEKDINGNIIENNDFIAAFVAEKIIKTDNIKDKIGKRGLQEGFKQWFELTQGSRKAPKGDELFEYMNKKFGQCKTTGWHFVKFVEPDEEEDDVIAEM
jgi:hypothetical protein